MTARLNPWGVTFCIFTGKEPIGGRSASLVARNYNQTHIKNHRMAGWHLSNIALSIWISRNWSEEEVLSKVNELYSYELPYNKSLLPTPLTPLAFAPGVKGTLAALGAAEFNR